jgi:TRAP-type C4-dicarboxylate transport system substrate-binding protein
MAQAKTVIRLATLAPASSSWVKILKRAAAEIEQKTGGEVVFKVFPGGVQGDEKVVVRKMKSGSLQAAGITAVGLSELAPDILVLQAPGLITDYRTLDKVRGQLRGEFEATFQKEGFNVLGWADVGLVNYYSNAPIRTPDDLRKAKVWVWDADPITRTTASTAGIRGIPKGVPDVLPALNTGQINTLLASPLACMSLQWYTKMKYRTDLPLAMTVGAIVVRSDVLEGMSPEHREIVLKVNKKWNRALIKKIRKDNARAIKIMEKRGIQTVTLTEEQKATWVKLAVKVQEALAGKVYSRALLNRVRKMTGWQAP